MREYVLRRILLFIPSLIGLSIAVFLLLRVLPGDVAMNILAGEEGAGRISEESLAALRQKLGTNRPLPEQYVRWIWDLAHLDMGTSYRSDRPVGWEIRRSFPVTVQLAVLTALVATIVAVPSGIVSAIRRDTWIDYVVRTISIAGLAMPTFWSGTLVVLGLSFYLSWSPPLGFTSLFEDPWTGLQQLIWPALVLGYYFAAIISRLTRSSMLEILHQDYLRTAWSKGLRERLIILRHGLPNALLPVITMIGIQFATLLGGTVIVEFIFALPGVGSILLEGIHFRDYPLVQTVVMLFGAIMLTISLCVDLAYAYIDPRIRYR